MDVTYVRIRHNSEFATIKLNSVEQSSYFFRSDSSSVTRDISRLLWNLKVYTVLTRTHQRSLFLAIWIQSIFETKRNTSLNITVSVKSKVNLSRYHHTGAKGERMCSCYSFLTSVLDGIEWSASRSGRTLLLGKDPWCPLNRRLGGPQMWSGQRG
jgi:hypothetical protein